MSAKYSVVARVNPGHPHAPKKFYPVVKSTGRVTLPQMAERIAEMSTLSSIDLVAALEGFLSTIPQELAKGNIVELGDFGTFRLVIRGEGADSAQEVTARNITKVRASFRAGKRFQHTLDGIAFEKASE